MTIPTDDPPVRDGLVALLGVAGVERLSGANGRTHQPDARRPDDMRRVALKLAHMPPYASD